MINFSANTGEPKSFLRLIVYFSAVLLVIWAFVLSQSDDKPIQPQTIEAQGRLDSLRALVGRDAIAYQAEQQREKSLFERAFPAFMVMGVLLLGGWVYLRRTGNKRPQNDLFTVVASQHLSPTHEIKIVQFQGAYWVLGITPQGMNLIKELDEFDASSLPAPAATQTPGFASLLERFQKKDDHAS